MIHIRQRWETAMGLVQPPPSVKNEAVIKNQAVINNKGAINNFATQAFLARIMHRRLTDVAQTSDLAQLLRFSDSKAYELFISDDILALVWGTPHRV
jgi:hypothetical protein